MVQRTQRQRALPGEAIFVTTRRNLPPAGACRMSVRLPDFAMLALPDADLRLIEAHVETCPACRSELALVLDSIAAEAMRTVAPPLPGAREAFINRACGAAENDRRCDGAPATRWDVHRTDDHQV